MKKLLRWLLIGFVLLLVVMFGVMFATRSLQPKVKYLGAAPSNIPAAERLAKALEFQTISYENGENEKEKLAALDSFYHWMQQTYPLVFLKAKVEKISHSFLITFQGKNKSLKPALFLAHLDVVPAETTHGKWNYPPFSGRFANDTIYGRGALDDKSIALAMLEAMEAKLSNGFVPERDICFAFGEDEETGGINGARNIAEVLKKRNFTAEFICDEGFGIMEGLVPGASQPVGIVGISEKGNVTLKISIDIPGGHSSMPKQDNANSILVQSLSKIDNFQYSHSFPEPQKLFFRHLAPEVSLPYRFLFSNMWITSPIIKMVMDGNNKTSSTIRTTHVTTIIKSGTKDNVVPSHAEAFVNFRILPGATCDDIVRQTQEIINDSRAMVQKVSDFNNPAPVSDTKSKGWTLITEAIHESFENTLTAPALAVTGTDCKNYLEISPNIYRFVPLRFNASNLGSIHGENEQLAAKNYFEAIRYYAILFGKL